MGTCMLGSTPPTSIFSSVVRIVGVRTGTGSGLSEKFSISVGICGFVEWRISSSFSSSVAGLLSLLLSSLVGELFFVDSSVERIPSITWFPENFRTS